MIAWQATLLQSSNVAYKFGVSGPFWYAAGATVQIILFAIVAIEIKRKCPAIHTMLEVVQIRWGTTAHLTFLFFGCLSSLIVTAMLILGGSATINALTGMNTYAASFLIPIAVVGYTAFGGLKGTYYASFTHTFIIYVALITFIWKVYGGPSDIASTDKMYDHLACASARVKGIPDYPTGTNSHNSFLTFKSGGGLIFGIANVVGNFGTVFADQSYWQGAIACKAGATWKGYLLGGIATSPLTQGPNLVSVPHADPYRLAEIRVVVQLSLRGFVYQGQHRIRRASRTDRLACVQIALHAAAAQHPSRPIQNPVGEVKVPAPQAPKQHHCSPGCEVGIAPKVDDRVGGHRGILPDV